MSLYALNKDVFEDNTENIEKWEKDVDKLNDNLKVYDVYGLSPVHLAFRMRRKEFINLFLEKGDPEIVLHKTKTPSPFESTVLEEALVLGDKEILAKVIKLRTQLKLRTWTRILEQTNSVYVKLELGLVSDKPEDEKDVVIEVFNADDTRLLVTITDKSGEKAIKRRIIFNLEKYGKAVLVEKGKKYWKQKLEFKDNDEEDQKELNAIVKSTEETMSATGTVSVTMKDFQFAAELDGRKLKKEKVGKFRTTLFSLRCRTQGRFRYEHHPVGAVDEVRDKLQEAGVYKYEISMEKPEAKKGHFSEYLARKFTVGKSPKVMVSEVFMEVMTVGFASNFPIEIEDLGKIVKTDSKEAKKLVDEIMERRAREAFIPPGFPVSLKFLTYSVKLVDFSWELPEKSNEKGFFEVSEGSKETEKEDKWVDKFFKMLSN